MLIDRRYEHLELDYGRKIACFATHVFHTTISLDRMHVGSNLISIVWNLSITSQISCFLLKGQDNQAKTYHTTSERSFQVRIYYCYYMLLKTTSYDH